MTPVTSDAIVPAEEDAAPAPKAWTSEPTTLEALLDEYIVEQKVSARWPGATLYLTSATKRDGSLTDALADQQRYKLFMVSCFQIQTYVHLFKSIKSKIEQPFIVLLYIFREVFTCQVAHQPLDLDENEYVICHGKSSFLKPEKLSKMTREHVGTGLPGKITFGFSWTQKSSAPVHVG